MREDLEHSQHAAVLDPVTSLGLFLGESLHGHLDKMFGVVSVFKFVFHDRLHLAEDRLVKLRAVIKSLE